MRHSPLDTSATSRVAGGVLAALPCGAGPAPPTSCVRPHALATQRVITATTAGNHRIGRVTDLRSEVRLTQQKCQISQRLRADARRGLRAPSALHRAEHRDVAVDDALALGLIRFERPDAALRGAAEDDAVAARHHVDAEARA